MKLHLYDDIDREGNLLEEYDCLAELGFNSPINLDHYFCPHTHLYLLYIEELDI